MAKLRLHRIVLYGIAAVGSGMVFSLTNNSFALYLLPFGLPNWLVAFLSQERAFIGGFLQPFIGMLSDRTNTRIGRRRPYFLIGVPLTALALIVLAQHPPLPVILTIMPVFALFLMIAYDPYLALMVDITPPTQRGLMGAANGFFGMIGQVVFLAVAAALWNANQTLVFYLVAAGLILAFAVTYFGVPEPPGGFPVERSEPAAAARQVSLVRYVRDVLRYRELSKYVVAQFFFWFGIGAAVPFLTLFAVRELHVDEGTSFLLILVLVLTSALSAVPAGLAGDRFGKKRVLTVGLLAFGGLILVSAGQTEFRVVVGCMAILGIAHAINNTLNFPALADLMPRDRAGEFAGLGSMCWSLAQPLGSLLGGVIADATGGYRAVFALTGVSILVSCAVLQLVHMPHRAAGPEPTVAGAAAPAEGG